jgi:hypothetical protein
MSWPRTWKSDDGNFSALPAKAPMPLQRRGVRKDRTHRPQENEDCKRTRQPERFCRIDSMWGYCVRLRAN